VTRVVVEAQADNSAQNVIAKRLRRGIRFMIRHLSLSMASDAPGLLREESRSLEIGLLIAVRTRRDYFCRADKFVPVATQIVGSCKSRGLSIA